MSHKIYKNIKIILKKINEIYKKIFITTHFIRVRIQNMVKVQGVKKTRIREQHQQTPTTLAVGTVKALK